MKQHLFLLPNKGIKAIFDNEIKGQLSDGAWENAQPYNHWQFWCMLDTAVSATGEFDFVKNGSVQDFHELYSKWYYNMPAKRTGYNLSTLVSKDCDLSYRMRSYYVDGMYYDIGRSIEIFVDSNGSVKTEASIVELCKQSEYWQKIVSKSLKDRPIAEFLADFTNKYNSYTRKQLLKDLKDIKAGMKMVLESF